MRDITQPQTIDEAWLNLAADVLLLAIDDVRHNPNPEKREWAREWLLSPAAAFFFEMVMTDIQQIDLGKWILEDCPELKKHER